VHEKCNLSYKIPKFFPAIFHNVSGCNSHLIVNKLKTAEGMAETEKTKCIPNNEENYISFSREVAV